MRNLYLKILPFILGLFPLLFSSCEKAVPDLPARPEETELQTITFKLNGFTTAINPLETSSKMSSDKQSSFSSLASKGLNPSTEEQFLYFWSFNEDNLVPDIAVNTSLAALTFTAASAEPSYTSGYGLSPYPAGKCLSLKGAKSILIQMPLSTIEQLTTLAFDIGSSDTGPKNFQISYSTDGGEHFTLLSDNNPMPIDRNRYSFDLSIINPAAYNNQFLIKIEPFEGDRGEGKPYNEATGTLKLDNIRLSGIYNMPGDDTEVPKEISKIHYYVFDADNHTLAATGTIPLNTTEPELSIKLSVGNYYASVFSNVSTKELLLPATVENASTLYLANAFENHKALIFGTNIPAFEVKNSVEREVLLKRYFSQVKFDFTDEEDLSFIHKIVFKPTHTPFVYSPFATSTSDMITDESVITIQPSFSQEHKSISFNQFMGDLAQPATVGYVVDVYGADSELLRTFEVNSTIKNNVQLTFTGNLLTDVDKPNNFQIKWNQEWDDELTETF